MASPIRPDWLREPTTHGLFALAGRDSLAGRLAAGGTPRTGRAAGSPTGSARFGDRLHLELTRTQRDGEDAFNAVRPACRRRSAACPWSPATTCASSIATTSTRTRRACASPPGRVLDDPKRPRDYSAEQYLKSSEEMAELFADVPDAIDNTVELAKRCNLELTLGNYYLPAFPVPERAHPRQLDRSERAQGLDAAPGEAPAGRRARRARTTTRAWTLELDVIVKMGFPGYFLIVADFINWAKHHDIPVGPGRGSGAGSLVAWALGITDLDPMPLRPAVRALPQSRTRVDARLRHRLLHGPP